jgi:hypothetical protein
MRVKIKEQFIKDIPYLKDNPKVNNNFEVAGTINDSLLLVDDDGNFFEVFPRKCQKIL